MMRGSGTRRVVMEVSSHGVALQRVSGVRFAGALFTNLTRDHLDLHGTMEEYYRAKRELFYRVVEGGPKLANADDEYGRRLAREVGRRIPPSAPLPERTTGSRMLGLSRAVSRSPCAGRRVLSR